MWDIHFQLALKCKCLDLIPTVAFLQGSGIFLISLLVISGHCFRHCFSTGCNGCCNVVRLISNVLYCCSYCVLRELGETDGIEHDDLTYDDTR